MKLATLDLDGSPDDVLAGALKDPKYGHLRDGILAEIRNRTDTRNKDQQSREPFDPRIEISADAKYLWRRLFIWFWAIPFIAAIILWLLRMA